MRLTVEEIRRFYRQMPLQEGPWNFGRKHFRVETLNGHWVKLNQFENRIRTDELSKHLVGRARIEEESPPCHLFFAEPCEATGLLARVFKENPR